MAALFTYRTQMSHRIQKGEIQRKETAGCELDLPMEQLQ